METVASDESVAVVVAAGAGRTKQKYYPGGGSKVHTLPSGEVKSRTLMSPAEREEQDRYEAEGYEGYDSDAVAAEEEHESEDESEDESEAVAAN
jgi:hypothetical protein